MKKFLFTALSGFLLLFSAKAQDLDINIIPLLNGSINGVWPLNASNARIQVTVCNNDGGGRSVPQFKVRPVISVDPTKVLMASSVLQTDLPAGWSIVSNTGNSIRLCNSIDTWMPGECRTFTILITPVALGSGPVSATLNWANGVTCSSSGTQTTGNITGNDNSGTSVTVSGTVPITLMNFEGVVNNCKSNLKWKVSRDSNTDKFQMEQSADGYRFSTVGTIAGMQGREDYDFIISHPGSKMYYRLKMLDLDGKTTYSNIINLTSACDRNSDLFRVYPNPVTSSVFNIEFLKAGKYDLFLINASGSVVREEKVTASPGQLIRISNINHPAGTYMLKVTESGSDSISKLTKLVIL